MNTRLQQFLSAENISQAQFADTIGVARASVSHILAGRNRPGFDFIERMAKRYPSLNLEWLITGKGKMYKADAERVNPRLWEDEEMPGQTGHEDRRTGHEDRRAGHEDGEETVREEVAVPRTSESRTLGKVLQSSTKQRNISRIVIFYDDNTFQELR